MANKSFPGSSYIVSGCDQDNIGSSSIKKNTSMLHGGSSLKHAPGNVKLGMLLAQAVEH